MKELQVFEKREVLGKDFKIYCTPDEPLFLAKDVAVWIEHSQADVMIRTVDENEKVLNIVQTLGGVQEAWFLTEDGLYEVLMQSRKSIAKQFKKQVKEILKSIRKHGAYMTPQKIEEVLLNPDTIIQLATTLKQEQEKAAALQLEVQAKEQIIEEQKPMYLLGSAVSSSETSILIGEFAKMLQQGGVSIGQKNLFEWLREKGYLCKEGSRYNMPTEKSMKLKIMEYSTTVINRSIGTFTRYTPKITGKGQVYFVNKFQAAMLPREVEQLSI